MIQLEHIHRDEIGPRQILRLNGGELLAVKPVSAHPDDWYLRVVLVLFDDMDDKYVTWIYNRQTDGCSNGHYFRDFDEALTDFQKRYGRNV